MREDHIYIEHKGKYVEIPLNTENLPVNDCDIRVWDSSAKKSIFLDQEINDFFSEYLQVEC